MSSSRNPSLGVMVHKSKMEMLCETLTHHCQELGADAKLPAVRQLAAELGVSSGTLHHALAELEREKVIVRRHGKGVYVDSSIRSKHMAVVLGMDPFRTTASIAHSLIYEAIHDLADAHDQSAEMFIDLPYDRNRALHRRVLGERLRCGIIQGLIVPSSSGAEQIRWLQGFGKPLVMAGWGDELDYSVRVDHAQMMRQGLDALHNQGCRKIACISHVAPGVRAFRDHVKALGLAYDPAWECHVHIEKNEHNQRDCRTNEELGHLAAKKLWDGKTAREHPDGVVIGDEMLTRGALATLNRRGVRIGRDIKVATHHTRNNPVLDAYEPLVHRMLIDPSAIGRAMYEMLNQLMQGKKPRRKINYISSVYQQPVA